jgi:ribosomal protein L37AE/L43A
LADIFFAAYAKSIVGKIAKEALKMARRKYKTNKPVECPKCGSTETRFLEPRDGMLIYDCNKCGCRFKVEGDE